MEENPQQQDLDISKWNSYGGHPAEAFYTSV